MSITKAVDVAYVRYRAPDLEQMRSFLLDFGLVEAAASPDRLFMRGYGPAPFLHATERGAPGFAALGIWVASHADLEKLAAHDGGKIEPLDAPGGGEMVRLTAPDGFVVEAICGQAKAPPIEAPAHTPWNQGGAYPRQSEFRRVANGPSHIKRLGHAVFGVSDFRTTEAWFKERFGFVTSDEIQPAPGMSIGAFMRCDRGEQPSDHHTIFLIQTPAPPDFNHAAFEVSDLDDLMAGHKHLHGAKRDPFWGVGRHQLGSQVFDYWRDPWDNKVEHWTDGDQLRASDGSRIVSLEQLMIVQWGAELPPMPTGPETGSAASMTGLARGASA